MVMPFCAIVISLGVYYFGAKAVWERMNIRIFMMERVAFGTKIP